MEQVGLNTALAKILEWCQEQKASDLHAQAGGAHFIRVQGRLSPVPAEIFQHLDDAQF